MGLNHRYNSTIIISMVSTALGPSKVEIGMLMAAFINLNLL